MSLKCQIWQPMWYFRKSKNEHTWCRVSLGWGILFTWVGAPAQILGEVAESSEHSWSIPTMSFRDVKGGSELKPEGSVRTSFGCRYWETPPSAHWRRCSVMFAVPPCISTPWWTRILCVFSKCCRTDEDTFLLMSVPKRLCSTKTHVSRKHNKLVLKPIFNKTL